MLKVLAKVVVPMVIAASLLPAGTGESALPTVQVTLTTVVLSIFMVSFAAPVHAVMLAGIHVK